MVQRVIQGHCKVPHCGGTLPHLWASVCEVLLDCGILEHDMLLLLPPGGQQSCCTPSQKAHYMDRTPCGGPRCNRPKMHLSAGSCSTAESYNGGSAPVLCTASQFRLLRQAAVSQQPSRLACRVAEVSEHATPQTMGHTL